MSGSKEDKRLWARRVLAWEGTLAKLDEIGVQANVREKLGYVAEAQAMRNTKQHLADELIEAVKGGDLAAGADTAERLNREAGTVVPAVADTASAKGIYRALGNLVASVDQEIRDTDATGRTKDKLTERMDSLRDAYADMSDATPKDELAALERTARRLLDDALKEGYLDKYRREMIPDQRNRAYAKMIKERYGVQVNFALDKEVDLGKLYDALSLLPQEHIRTDSLTDIAISAADDALGDYGNKRIRIDAAKVRKRPKIEYKVDGSSKSLDTLSIVTLHEVGHAVDDKAKIMAGAADESYGGWAENVPVATVAAAYWSTLASKIDVAFKDAMLEEIEGALGGGPGKRPDGMPDREWSIAKATLAACQKLATDEKPWETPRAVGDTVYHYTYNKWFAYSKKARDAVTVRDYQWRAPAEWFAELYAASWATKKKPATAVNAKAAEYMYREAV